MLQKAVVACAFFLSAAAGECSMVIENIEDDMGKNSNSLSSNGSSSKSEASTKTLSSDITQFNTQQQSKFVKIITNKDDFLKLDETAIKNINELKFEGIELDEEFLLHFCKILGMNFRKIAFNKCNLGKNVSFGEILDSCNVENLLIKNCSITIEDLSYTLSHINPYIIRTLDISDNNLGAEVVSVLKNEIFERMILRDINVEGNDLTEKDIAEIKNLCCK